MLEGAGARLRDAMFLLEHTPNQKSRVVIAKQIVSNIVEEMPHVRDQLSYPIFYALLASIPKGIAFKEVIDAIEDASRTLYAWYEANR